MNIIHTKGDSLIEKYILVIEKDKLINSIICQICNKSGYITKSVSEYDECIEDLLNNCNKINLIIINSDQKGENNENIITSVRNKVDTPIISISTDNSFSARANALNSGADDFLGIPFDVSEFLARVNSVLRRYRISSFDECLKFKDLLLDVKRHVVLVNSSHIDLTVKEFDILKLLMQNPQEIISKEDIYKSVWQENFFKSEQILNTHIYNLRKKLNLCGDKEKYIHTVWRKGYRLSID